MWPRIFGQDANILASHAGTTAGTVRRDFNGRLVTVVYYEARIF
jgi:hypothetical protein